MKLFLDSSVMFKRYFIEAGSTQAGAWMGRAEELLVSALMYPEVISAICRAKTEKRVEPGGADAIQALFIKEWPRLEALSVDTGIYVAAGIVEKTGLKSPDAIHVAAALRSGCDLFLTADRQQAAAAKKMGLKVEMV